MATEEKFSLLRTILRTLGLSTEAADDIVARILDFLAGRDGKAAQTEFPYLVRDNFLSPAEQSFYLVLKAAVAEWAVICPKVGLGDLFYARSSDPSFYRTCTNRIDRKHVDFLLCDPKTVKPLLGIELDDSSHQRADRQERDEFVQKVFDAAQLLLVRLPVRRAYAVAELNSLLRGSLDRDAALSSAAPAAFAAASPRFRCPQHRQPRLLSHRIAHNAAVRWSCAPPAGVPIRAGNSGVAPTIRAVGGLSSTRREPG